MMLRAPALRAPTSVSNHLWNRDESYLWLETACKLQMYKVWSEPMFSVESLDFTNNETDLFRADA